MEAVVNPVEKVEEGTIAVKPSPLQISIDFMDDIQKPGQLNEGKLTLKFKKKDDMIEICSIPFDKSVVRPSIMDRQNTIDSLLGKKYTLFSDLYNILFVINNISGSELSITKSNDTLDVTISKEKEKEDEIISAVQAMSIINDDGKRGGLTDNDKLIEYINDFIKRIKEGEPEGGYFDKGKQFIYFYNLSKNGYYTDNQKKEINNTEVLKENNKRTINNIDNNKKTINNNIDLSDICFENNEIENTQFNKLLEKDNTVLFKVVNNNNETYWYPGKITNDNAPYNIKPSNEKFQEVTNVPRKDIRFVETDNNGAIKSTAAAPATPTPGGNLPSKKPRTRVNRKYKSRTRKSKSRK